MMTGPWPSEVYLGELPKLRDDLVKDAERRMRLCLESLEKEGLTATGEVLIGGPSHVIIEQAAAINADLLVMGTHGRTGITHLLIGSVAERVIRHAPCPVFVVRERKAAEARPVPAVGPAPSSCEGLTAPPVLLLRSMPIDGRRSADPHDSSIASGRRPRRSN